MNYEKHYNLLISRAKTRIITGYSEKHHIIPKCLGGSNKNTNIVRLTPEEHYLAHLLLIKIYPKEPSLVYAANMMTLSSSLVLRNNKSYGWVKRKLQLICKQRVGDKNPSFGKSWYFNPATNEEGKFAAHEVPDTWLKGRKAGLNKPPVSKVILCKHCGQSICDKTEICKNTQRINRFIKSFGFDHTVLGTNNFYKEYDRIVSKLEYEYVQQHMSVEELKVKYKLNTNETMRCILKSLGIERRNLSESIKNYRNSLIGKT